MQVKSSDLYNVVYMRGRNNAAIPPVAPGPRRPVPKSVRELMTSKAHGTHVSKHGGPALVAYQHPAPHLPHFERGPIGLLQWMAAAHPSLFKRLQKDRPDLLQAAEGMAKAGKPGPCPGANALHGFSAVTDASSWYDSLLNYTGKVLNLYGTYKAIQSGQTDQVQNQVQRQVQNAQANLPPQQLGPISPNTPPPDPATVTTPHPAHSGGTGTVATLATVGIGGLFLAKLFHLF